MEHEASFAHTRRIRHDRLPFPIKVEMTDLIERQRWEQITRFSRRGQQYLLHRSRIGGRGRYYLRPQEVHGIVRIAIDLIKDEIRRESWILGRRRPSQRRKRYAVAMKPDDIIIIPRLSAPSHGQNFVYREVEVMQAVTKHGIFDNWKKPYRRVRRPLQARAFSTLVCDDAFKSARPTARERAPSCVTPGGGYSPAGAEREDEVGARPRHHRRPSVEELLQFGGHP